MIGLGTSVVVDGRIKDLRRSLIINLGLGRSTGGDVRFMDTLGGCTGIHEEHERGGWCGWTRMWFNKR